MNLLFERIKLQAQFSRLYQHLDPAVADDVVARAWEIERTKREETPGNDQEQQLSRSLAVAIEG